MHKNNNHISWRQTIVSTCMPVRMWSLTLAAVDIEACQVNDLIIAASICHCETTLSSSLNQPTYTITAHSVTSTPTHTDTHIQRVMFPSEDITYTRITFLEIYHNHNHCLLNPYHKQTLQTKIDSCYGNLFYFIFLVKRRQVPSMWLFITIKFYR